MLIPQKKIIGQVLLVQNHTIKTVISLIASEVILTEDAFIKYETCFMI
jgi:hypothetical protein